MSDLEQLRMENEELKKEVEAYRQSELDRIRSELALAQADAQHFREEAQRNASLGHTIHREAQTEIQRLRSKIEALEGLNNVGNVRGRQPVTGSS